MESKSLNRIDITPMRELTMGEQSIAAGGQQGGEEWPPLHNGPPPPGGIITPSMGGWNF